MRLPQSIIHSRFIQPANLLTIVLLTVALLAIGPISAGAAVSQVVCTPSTLPFGAVVVGQTKTLPVTLTNTGAASVTISGIAVGNTQFTSDASLPLVLLAGQSVILNVSFTPTAIGWTGGTIKFSKNTSSQPLYLQVQGSGLNSPAITASPSTVSFGQVAIGSTATVPVVLTNARSWSVILWGMQTTGAGVSLQGPIFPVTLGVGQSITVNLAFAPQSAATTAGSLFVSGPALAIPVTGTGTASATGQLSVAPAPLNFGTMTVGTTKTQPLTLSATGASVTVSSASSSSAQFALQGASFPLTIAAGQSVPLNVAFTPQSSGTVSGSLLFVSNASNSQTPGSNPGTVPLTGTGVMSATLATSPATLVFGNAQVGGSTSQLETLTNTGGTSLTISAASASGAGFSLSGLALPLTLAAGQSTSFTVLFSPATGGAATGSVSLASSASDPTLSIPLSGTGVTPGTLAANSPTLTFSSVQVGSSASLSETLTNTGGSTVTVSQANLSGTGFSITGLTLPLNLASNQSVTFTATYTPTSAGPASGSLTVASSASDSQLNIALSATGTAPGQLAASPTSLSFGSLAVGSSSSLNGSLTASGASLTITSAGLSNSEFVLSGISLPVTLAAGQSASYTVTFTPQSSGSTSASLSFSCSGSNSPAVQSMSGTGMAPVQHTVDLNWTGSPTAVSYNIYRGTVSGGPYTMISSSSTTAYADNTVVSGQTYYYVAASVDDTSNESGYSNETQAAIPSP